MGDVGYVQFLQVDEFQNTSRSTNNNIGHLLQIADISLDVDA